MYYLSIETGSGSDSGKLKSEKRNRKIGKSENRKIGKSENRKIGKSENRKIGKSDKSRRVGDRSIGASMYCLSIEKGLRSRRGKVKSKTRKHENRKSENRKIGKSKNRRIEESKNRNVGQVSDGWGSIDRCIDVLSIARKTFEE